jgi:hypothetical protein
MLCNVHSLVFLCQPMLTRHCSLGHVCTGVLLYSLLFPKIAVGKYFPTNDYTADSGDSGVLTFSGGQALAPEPGGGVDRSHQCDACTVLGRHDVGLGVTPSGPLFWHSSLEKKSSSLSATRRCHGREHTTRNSEVETEGSECCPPLL